MEIQDIFSELVVAINPTSMVLFSWCPFEVLLAVVHLVFWLHCRVLALIC